jgi:hypothetical protein
MKAKMLAFFVGSTMGKVNETRKRKRGTEGDNKIQTDIIL